MAIRNVYTDEEKKMLAKFEELADKMSGWNKEMRIRVASEDSIRNWTLFMDPWNPLWLDENYARKTRWDGTIAPPLYQECITLVSWMLEIPPSVGRMCMLESSPLLMGENWEFFKPVRPGDSFKIWRRRPTLEDVTSPDGEELRRFNFTVHDLDLINQKDELVSTCQTFLSINIASEPPAAPSGPQKPYVYTQEELDYIESMYNQEEIRGAETRYWEDVNIGDEVKPVVMGPTTAWDMLVFTAGRQDVDLLPMMIVRKKTPGQLVKDPVTGITHHQMERHITHHGAQIWGMSLLGMHSGAVERQLLARMASNWMGDDGFIRYFRDRNYSPVYIGDTNFGHGEVVNKRVENGEHLVDLALWLENIRGNVVMSAAVTVSLCARADL